MRARGVLVLAVVVISACTASGQMAVPPLPPPLLPVEEAPLAVVPRPGTVPDVEYEHGREYLPEVVEDRRLADAVCGPIGRWWFGASLELAWVRDQSLPTNLQVRMFAQDGMGATFPRQILPTAGRRAGQFDGALGLMLGRWFGESKTHGIDASLFTRGALNTFDVTVPDAVLFFSEGRGRGAPQFYYVPPTPTWGILSVFPVTLETSFTTVDVNYRHKLLATENARIDFLAGYRFAYLGDELYLGTYATDNDYKQNRAAVLNRFNGGQIGLAGEFCANRWYASGAAKIAFGATTAEVKTSGVFVGAEGQVGEFFRPLCGLRWREECEFAVMPSFNAQLGRYIGRHTRVFVGYSFTYLSRASRLDDAVDTRNRGLSFTDFWVQSLGLGAELRY